MDRIAVSGTVDTGSIPVWGANIMNETELFRGRKSSVFLRKNLPQLCLRSAKFERLNYFKLWYILTNFANCKKTFLVVNMTKNGTIKESGLYKKTQRVQFVFVFCFYLS